MVLSTLPVDATTLLVYLFPAGESVFSTPTDISNDLTLCCGVCALKYFIYM